MLKLGTISEINPKNLNYPIENSDDLEVSFIPMRNVEEETGKIDSSSKRYYKEVKKGYTHFINGDILFAKITPCMENGKIAIANNLYNGIGFGSTEFHVIRLKYKDFITKYFFYYLLQEKFRKEARRYMKGTAGQLRVPANYLQDVLIPLPPLKEQKRIVSKIEELFSKLDVGIKYLKKNQILLEQYRQSVLKYAFGGKLTEKWRISNSKRTFPAFRFSSKINVGQKNDKKIERSSFLEDKNLQKLPLEWKWVALEQIADVRTGATPLKSNSKYYKGGNIPWINSSALNETSIRKTDKMITKYAVSKYNLKMFPLHTLLIAMLGDGKTRGKVSELLIEATINQACAAITLNESVSTLRPFVKLFFQSYYEDIRKLSSGGVQMNLNLGIIKSTKIPIPSLEEANLIVEIVDRNLSIINKLSAIILQSLRRSEVFRKCILEYAFKGKLVSQDSNDEPVSILLERIKNGKLKENKNNNKSHNKQTKLL